MAFRTVQKGDRVSEYVLLEKLGEGGFGEVWKAEHSQIPGKFVAIKIPTRPESMELLRTEALFQHQLEHPNIVRTIGLNTQADPPYFVMEYVEGRNLRQFMQQEGILPPPYAIDIAVQILEALAFAHSRGIVHKDIKPENVLVERKRIQVQKDHKAYLHFVKITDLGLGKMPDPRTASDLALSESARTTGVRQLTGTLFYSAPEQMRGNGGGDAQSDLYSVGVVLYEMLTGELPLGMDLPSELNPVVTERLDRICKRALSIDREQRYPNARDMIADLVSAKEDFLHRRPATPARTTAAASGAPAPGHRLFRGLRSLEWGALGLVAVLLALFGHFMLRPRPAPDGAAGAGHAPAAPTLGGPIHFETTPAGAGLLIDGAQTATTPCDLPLTFGRHQILVSKEFFEPRLLALEPRTIGGRPFFALIDERAKTEIAIRECASGAVFDRIELFRQKGRLVIRTPGLSPVAVHLNSETVGQTPYEDEIDAGLHHVRLSRENYRTFEFEVRVASGATVIRELALIPESAALNAVNTRHKITVTSTPPEATVYLEGARQAERTPCALELPDGIYQLRLELTHYEPWEERITVSGGPATFSYPLVRIRGRVTFDSEPPGARIWLDGQEIGTTPHIGFVEGGPHTVEFRLEGYYGQIASFTVADRSQSLPVKATLQRIPPGQLSVECEIAGADVWINDKSAGRSPLSGHRVEPGRYRVRVLGVLREVDVEAGTDRRVAFTARDLGLVFVPGGEFEFGCNAREARPPDLLARSVDLGAFYADVCEVTNEQYGLFLEYLRHTNDHSRCDPAEGRNKDHVPTWWGRTDLKDFLDPRKPVVGVDYYDAAAYAGWAGKRLPTEEEWEKAARGTDGRRFPWGHEWREGERRCNWYDYQGERDGFAEATAPVGHFPDGRSPYGCHDMAGNVWEWTSTFRDYPRTTNRIVRGGSYLQKGDPVWARDFHPPNQKMLKTVGFRCVLDAK